MAEGILKFNLPEEQREFEMATNAVKWYSVVFDLNQYLRNKLKYETNFDTAINELEKARTELFDLISDAGLVIE